MHFILSKFNLQTVCGFWELLCVEVPVFSGVLALGQFAGVTFFFKSCYDVWYWLGLLACVSMVKKRTVPEHNTVLINVSS